MSIRHILVPTDFGRASRRATRLALDLATAIRADVTLLHAYELPDYAYGVVPPVELTKLEEGARRALVDEIAGLVTRDLRVEGRVRLAPAYVAIADATKETDADLIVMGTHGRGGVEHVLLGSVAERTVRLSPVPVLTVPHASFASREEAGQRLAEAARDLRPGRPTVIALSRGALVPGAEVARAMECMQDVLLVTSLRDRAGSLLGGVAEDGTFVRAGARAGRVEPTNEPEAIERARAGLSDRALSLRGSRWIADVVGRAVIVVADALEDPAPVAVAAATLRRMGARTVVAAVPVCSSSVAAELATCADRVLVVETLDADNDAANVYRDAHEPSDDAARRLLGSGMSEHR